MSGGRRGPGPGAGDGREHGHGAGPGQDTGHGHQGHGNGPGDGHGGGPGRGSGGGHGPGPGGGGHGDGPGDVHGPDDNGGHSHGHSHSHGPAAPVSVHLRKIIGAILIPFAAAVVVGLVVLWPGGAPAHERTGVGFDRQTQEATVTKVVSVDCKSVNASGETPTGDTSTAEGSSAQQQATGDCKKATIRVDTGDDKGRTFTEIVQPDQSRQLHQDEKVVVAYEPSAPKDLQYSVADVNRRFPMALLAGIFALAVVIVGRLRGVMALVALAVSFMVLTFFILPAVLQGSNPLLVAVIGASAIMLIALYMCHGLSARTSVAVLGTLISLVLIGVLGSLFIGWAALTGNTDDNTGLIHGLYPSIDMSGLLLAGVIIGSLGVLDDVTVTQTSAVWELHEANPTMGWRGLYRAGIRIGRDHIASVVNTLVLAYAGAALPLLLLFSIAQSSVGAVANSELVAEEIVRTLVGSIGLVASVPVTTLLAALMVSADRPGMAPLTAGAPAGAGPGTGATAVGAGAAPQAVAARAGKGRRRKH
ncbi:YibE/F family protein [Streptomyces sp. WI04-05B]|uniref:YibE/F family protein n=1 Tax=Streptomyces TaxID=1883 RepID=UPI0029AE0922|nr:MULTISPECIES: YibE/F family protein [unclassified Streptomyces]MDX2542915.1 YibE/F family protein [Streptomyces sp. WI04-05B]MDX2588459.1 YibE/F family protein [Streptomyces sp. WI04-05A]MDX3747231.1 YibE/F family protein [Streptomyces sp. AK08-02]